MSAEIGVLSSLWWRCGLLALAAGMLVVGVDTFVVQHRRHDERRRVVCFTHRPPQARACAGASYFSSTKRLQKTRRHDMHSGTAYSLIPGVWRRALTVNLCGIGGNQFLVLCMMTMMVNYLGLMACFAEVLQHKACRGQDVRRHGRSHSCVMR